MYEPILACEESNNLLKLLSIMFLLPFMLHSITVYIEASGHSSVGFVQK
jgi:hypothetical protein